MSISYQTADVSKCVWFLAHWICVWESVCVCLFVTDNRSWLFVHRSHVFTEDTEGQCLNESQETDWRISSPAQIPYLAPLTQSSSATQHITTGTEQQQRFLRKYCGCFVLKNRQLIQLPEETELRCVVKLSKWREWQHEGPAFTEKHRCINLMMF